MGFPREIPVTITSFLGSSSFKPQLIWKWNCPRLYLNKLFTYKPAVFTPHLIFLSRLSFLGYYFYIVHFIRMDECRRNGTMRKPSHVAYAWKASTTAMIIIISWKKYTTSVDQRPRVIRCVIFGSPNPQSSMRCNLVIRIVSGQRSFAYTVLVIHYAWEQPC